VKRAPRHSRMTPTLRLVFVRLLRLLLVVWVASVIVFAAIFVVGDPARLVLPVGSSQDAIESFRREAGLDQPLIEQYIAFLSGALQGDFGNSLILGEPALNAVVARLPVTATIVACGMVIGLIVGVVLGVLAASRPGSSVDNLVNLGSYVLTSAPQFWIGLMLILLVAVPSMSIATSGFDWDLGHLLLPVITLAVLPTGRVAQVTRALMVAERTQQYVTTARAKGVGEGNIALRHQFRNVAIPLATLVFYDGARMFVGDALVVEVVFGLGGVGGLTATALLSGDIYVAQAAVMLAALVVALLNLVADVVVYFIDPLARDVVRDGRR
jgi:peptide/nickel transport system permease protein